MKEQARKPRQGEFFKMPVAIAKRTDIGLAAKMVFARLKHAMREKGFCFLGLRTIAKDIGTSVGTVQRGVADLQLAKDLVVKYGGHGRRTVYRLPESVPETDTLSDPDMSTLSETRSVPVSEPSVPATSTQVYPKRVPNRQSTKKTTLAQVKKWTPRKPREPDVIWDAVVARWFKSGVAPSNRTRVGKIVRDLKVLGATPELLAARVEAYKAAWPTAACTPEAIVKHWDHPFEESKGDTGGVNMPNEADRDYAKSLEGIPETSEEIRRRVKKELQETELTGPDRRIENVESSA